MKMKKNFFRKFFKNRTIQFSLLILLLNTVYFFVYYSFLSIDLSLLSYLFTLLLISSFVLLLMLF
ncbi:hypothetical protein KJ641_04030, partial [Patescibacteria group bacterium]|nr:hypothetical protein [Patescibacteria group bacterium]MBU1896008.1 hypothetical protein [Patescibacteria group bacterium]